MGRHGQRLLHAHEIVLHVGLAGNEEHLPHRDVAENDGVLSVGKAHFDFVRGREGREFQKEVPVVPGVGHGFGRARPAEDFDPGPGGPPHGNGPSPLKDHPVAENPRRAQSALPAGTAPCAVFIRIRHLIGQHIVLSPAHTAGIFLRFRHVI